MLITNRQRNVALIGRQGHTWIHLITISAHGLESTKITEAELERDWKVVKDYPIERALSRFKDIAETQGATIGASKLLEGIQ